jgi:predicted enzyme related to lactoylglutathione lyase
VGSKLWTVVVDAHDPAALGRWWASVLDWKIFHEAPDEVVITKDDKTFPGIVFVTVPEAKTVKNRLHIDLNPDADRDAEIERLVGLGARKVDVGQRDVAWTVLADPEGNEFCVLRAREGGV